jgi:hypothetical protein
LGCNALKDLIALIAGNLPPTTAQGAGGEASDGIAFVAQEWQHGVGDSWIEGSHQAAETGDADLGRGGFQLAEGVFDFLIGQKRGEKNGRNEEGRRDAGSGVHRWEERGEFFRQAPTGCQVVLGSRKWRMW